MKIADWITSASRKLDEAKITTSRLDAQLLACHTLNCTKVWLLSHPEHELDKSAQVALDDLLHERLKYVPLAYLFGQKEFYGRSFQVNRHVLVPRPESEALIDLALTITSPLVKVIDIGCGSGILGITLALQQPECAITLSDISSEALSVAAANVVQFQLAERITLLQQDLLKGDQTQYDLVLANLPYVPNSMRNNKDLGAEPPIALFSGTDGLDHYRKLFSLLASRSIKPHCVITESLIEQHDALEQLAAISGYKVSGNQDLAQLFTS